MPVDFIAITQGECNDCIGGIKRSALVDCGYVDWDAIVVDANGRIVSIALTLAGAGKVVELEYDDDETAFFNSTGERTGKKHRNNQEAFLKFDCTNNDKLRAAELIKSGCCLVAVHQFNSGVERVQGIDIVPDGVDYKAVKSIQVARGTSSEMSDTSANTDRVEVTISSVSRNVNTALADPDTFGIDEFLLL